MQRNEAALTGRAASTGEGEGSALRFFPGDGEGAQGPGVMQGVGDGLAQPAREQGSGNQSGYQHNG